MLGPWPAPSIIITWINTLDIHHFVMCCSALADAIKTAWAANKKEFGTLPEPTKVFYKWIAAMRRFLTTKNGFFLNKKMEKWGHEFCASAYRFVLEQEGGYMRTWFPCSRIPIYLRTRRRIYDYMWLVYQHNPIFPGSWFRSKDVLSLCWWTDFSCKSRQLNEFMWFVYMYQRNGFFSGEKSDKWGCHAVHNIYIYIYIYIYMSTHKSPQASHSVQVNGQMPQWVLLSSTQSDTYSGSVARWYLKHGLWASLLK
jgi:hypothetical protein